MITVKNLKKTYILGNVKVEALKNASFEVKDGEFVIIFGNSGSGKSTLLHLLGLLEEITEGTIIIDGRDTSMLSETEKSNLRLEKMGFVFQQYNILPELTVLENVILPALMTNAHKHDIIRRAKSIIEYVGLGHRLNHIPAELSGGERQRVSIARSLINNPEIILADEPIANLDSKNSDNIISWFNKLNAELKVTILLVTHNPKYLHLASKIICLEDGSIKYIKTKKNVDKRHVIKKLREYVHRNLQRGISKKVIREHLLKKGWSSKLVGQLL